MTSLFEQLLKELGSVFHLSLHADKIGACSLFIPPELVIQLQLDSSQENLFVFCKIVELPPGKFRENVFVEALKQNGNPDPVVGVLAYVAATNHLALFQNYPISILNGERLAGLFGAFLETAENWRKAIQNGQSAPPRTGSSRLNPFGLR